MQETLSANRMDLLNKQKKKNTKKAIPNVFGDQIKPCIKGLRKRLMKYWDNIQHDEVCKNYSQHLLWLHTVNTKILVILSLDPNQNQLKFKEIN